MIWVQGAPSHLGRQVGRRRTGLIVKGHHGAIGPAPGAGRAPERDEGRAARRAIGEPLIGGQHRAQRPSGGRVGVVGGAPWRLGADLDGRYVRTQPDLLGCGALGAASLASPHHKGKRGTVLMPKAGLCAAARARTQHNRLAAAKQDYATPGEIGQAPTSAQCVRTPFPMSPEGHANDGDSYRRWYIGLDSPLKVRS